MKIIDLLNKIAKGEEVPEKIKYNKKIYTRFRNTGGNTLYYYQVYGEFDFLLQNIELVSELNDEVEIIEEEKEIEKLSFCDFAITINENASNNDRILMDKINEIIDKLNDMRDKE